MAGSFQTLGALKQETTTIPIVMIAGNKGNKLSPLHSTPQSTRMPEYQMAHACTKAIAALQSVEARDVGCGSSRPEHAQQPDG